MSTNRLRIQADQENQHKVAPAKMDLRAPPQNENSISNIPTKRPLAQKGNANFGEKRIRVPLGGKDSNQSMPGLQRSKSSLPSTFASLRQTPSQGFGQNLHQNFNQSFRQNVTQNTTQPGRKQREPLAAKPALAKSSSSLSFFAKPTTPCPSLLNVSKARAANPHKNDLFPSAESHRSSELVPRLASDTLQKGPAKPLPPLSGSLSDTFSEHTASLHASNVKFDQHWLENVDPMKKGYRSAEREVLIDRLAEDENSIETVPERPVREENDVPLGCSPLTKAQAPFLYEESPTAKLTDRFGPDVKFFSDEEICSETEAEQNRAFYEDPQASSPHNLGLSAADLENLLDFDL